MTQEERTPQAGLEAWSMDEHFVGEVIEVGHTAFRIRVPRAPDVWVRNEAVFTVSEGRVTLVCNASSVERYAAQTTSGL